jgi:hypothetical protein
MKILILICFYVLAAIISIINGVNIFKDIDTFWKIKIIIKLFDRKNLICEQNYFD